MPVPDPVVNEKTAGPEWGPIDTRTTEPRYSPLATLLGWVERLTSVGTQPTDSEADRLPKQTLILASTLIVVLATAWTVIYFTQGRPLSAAIPLSYQVGSVVSLVIFSRTKRFGLYRTSQLALILILPVALQWTLGGFTKSGAVMLWAFVAPLGALMFGARPWPWFAAFLVLTTITGLADDALARNVQGLSSGLARTFFGLNVAAFSSVTFLALRYFIRQRDRARAQTEAERQKSERLLLNILPVPIAERLKAGEEVIADVAPEVTVLFADIVGFTPLAQGLTAEDTVDLLNDVFSALDDLAGRRGLEKIKTVGDEYMLVGGLPEPLPDHDQAVADFALDVIHYVEKKRLDDLQIRVGIDTGPVIAGVIGKRKFSYDLWGNTVNTASRMASHGVPGRVQVTERVYEQLRKTHAFEPRGEIDVKGKGTMHTYFLVGTKDAAQPAKSDGEGDGREAPQAAAGS